MNQPKDDPPIAAASLDSVREFTSSLGVVAEALDALATVAKNELHALRTTMREEGMTARTMADWETFHTVPVLLDIVIAQAATAAAAAEAIERTVLQAKAA